MFLPDTPWLKLLNVCCFLVDASGKSEFKTNKTLITVNWFLIGARLILLKAAVVLLFLIFSFFDGRSHTVNDVSSLNQKNKACMLESPKSTEHTKKLPDKV